MQIAASRIPRHHRAAAGEVQLVLLDAAVPHFLAVQRPSRAARYAHLAQRAILVHAVVHRPVVSDLGVGEDDLQPCARAEPGRKKLAVDAELSQAGLDEHRNHRAQVPRRAGDLHLVAQRQYEVDERPGQRGLADVDVALRPFGVQARYGLRRVEVLLERQANGGGQPRVQVGAAAAVDVSRVERREPRLAVAQLQRRLADCLGHVAAAGLRRRLHVARALYPIDDGAHPALEVLVQLCRFGRELHTHRAGPLGRRALRDGHALERRLPAVVGHLVVALRYARHALDVPCHGKGKRLFTRQPGRAGYVVADSSSCHWVTFLGGSGVWCRAGASGTAGRTPGGRA